MHWNQVPVATWMGAVACISLLSIYGWFWAALCAGVFVFGSMVLGQGSRWASRGTFMVAIFALAVTFGFPHPMEWPALVKSIRPMISMDTASAK
jgi:hypothetical protein